MDGLLVYRQYLENIRGSIKNFKLPELESKEFMGILHRVNQIEDLSYIDVILKNAGLNLSFIGDRSFLDKKVVLKSKLGSYFEESVDMDATMKSALSDYMSIFMSEEDEIIKDIEEFSGENGVPEISLDYFPKSSVRYYSAKEVIEKNKDTLSALFGALEEMDRKLEKSEEIDKKRAEEMGIVEEYFDEETADEELVLKDKDIKELIYEEAVEEKKVSPVVFIEKKEEISETLDIEDDFEVETDIEIEEKDDVSNFELGKEEIVSDLEDSELEIFDKSPELRELASKKEKPINNIIDTSFLDDDPEEEVDESFDISEEEDFEIEKSSFTYEPEYESKYESDETEDYEDDYEETYSREENRYQRDIPDIEDDFQEQVSRKDFNKFFDDNDIEDRTGYELEDDLKDDDELLLRDTDPREQNAFEEATNYFLTGKSQTYNENSLKKLYKSKEKIVKAEGVNDTDDGLAKMVLALSDGLMNLPHLTGGLFRKAKKGSKKMRETMIVEDDEDDDF